MQGKRRKLSKYVRWGVYVPEDLALRISTLFHNQYTGKQVYGAQSQLMCDLLRKWVNEQEAKIAVSSTSNSEAA